MRLRNSESAHVEPRSRSLPKVGSPLGSLRLDVRYGRKQPPLVAVIGTRLRRAPSRGTGLGRERSLDELVGTEQQLPGDFQAKLPGSSPIDQQFKDDRLLHRQIARFRPFENPVYVDR